MAEQFIPDDVTRFVLDKIDSVAQLEAMLLLRGDQKKEWSVAALAARLYISEAQTAELLLGLRAQGLVAAGAQKPTAYRYHPKNLHKGDSSAGKSAGRDKTISRR